MNTTRKTESLATHRIPIYEVRLVRSRRPLRLAEKCVSDSSASARALHSLIGMTDREHLACLFVNGTNHVTGAHIAFVGGQHAIGAIDVRVILRAALAACASAHSNRSFCSGAQNVRSVAVSLRRTGRPIDLPTVQSRAGTFRGRQQKSHNHPSGDPSPSNEDLECTAAILRVAEVVGIPVVDHVIVTREQHRYYSMHAKGTLPRMSEP